MLSIRENILYIEEVPYYKIIKKFGTPCWVYSKNTILKNIRNIQQYYSKINCNIFYSVKSCPNIAILKLIQECGLGADIVSGGELYRCKKAGIKGNKIVYSGVGKTDEEIIEAIKYNILFFNAESTEEINNLQNIARFLKTKVNISFRVNPDIDAKTHKKINTGKKDTKFGIPVSDIISILNHKHKFPHLNFIGIDSHIGSQITTAEPFLNAYKKIIKIAKDLEKYNFFPDYIDFGGGFGINYSKDNVKEFPFANIVKNLFDELNKLPYKYVIEPGRFISGPSGILLAKVLYNKNTDSKNFVIIDSGFNDLLRPAMYDSYHEITLCESIGQDLEKSDIVGPLCETGDILAKDRTLEKMGRGQYICIHDTGAYGSSMSSMYNSHPLAPEILVNGNTFKLIRKKANYKNIIQNEIY